MADAAAMPGAGTPYSPASLRLGRDGGTPAGIVHEGGHHSEYLVGTLSANASGSSGSGASITQALQVKAC